MDKKLSRDKEKLVLDNLGLVYFIAKKLGVTQISSDYEDIISIGTIGLVKAAITYDASKNNAFTTYASRCIRNDILTYYRKANKYGEDISIDESKDNERTLSDLIASPTSDFPEKIEQKEELTELVKIVLNCLKGKQRISILYRMGEISQKEIAKRLKVTQAYVSKIQIEAGTKVRKILERQENYHERFSMEILENTYIISFSSKEISNFNKILERFFKKMTSVEKLPNFRINCNKGQVKIQLPAVPEAFSFIAEIIQEIDDFSMEFMK